jgi:hypothetical protein
MSDDGVKKADQIAVLEASRAFTDTGEWKGLFSYPNAGWDLVQQGLVKEDKTITSAGRAALWFLGKGDDPLPASKSFVSFAIAIEPPAPVKAPSIEQPKKAPAAEAAAFRTRAAVEAGWLRAALREDFGDLLEGVLPDAEVEALLERAALRQARLAMTWAGDVCKEYAAGELPLEKDLIPAGASHHAHRLAGAFEQLRRGASSEGQG